jgi:predicted DNA-binding transcriptional regulator YafY
MPKQDIDAAGRVREYWNDTLAAIPDPPRANIPARSVRFYDAAGGVLQTRAFTPEEVAAADAAAAAAQAAANAKAVDDALGAAMAALQAIIGQANADIRTDPSQEIKDIAQVLKRVIRAVRRQYDAAN